MPKGATNKPENPPHKPRKANVTSEATSYLGGLFAEFHAQMEKYHDLTTALLSAEARVELAEKTLCLTRDHLAVSVENSDCALPHNWDEALKTVRFVGVRLADACMALLREHRKLTPEQIVGGLNDGMYRFRTNSPLREIHAALLKRPDVEKNEKCYVWTGTTDKQIPLRLRVMERKPVVGEALKEGTTNLPKSEPEQV
jgi:hypothetical protein